MIFWPLGYFEMANPMIYLVDLVLAPLRIFLGDGPNDLIFGPVGYFEVANPMIYLVDLFLLP